MRLSDNQCALLVRNGSLGEEGSRDMWPYIRLLASPIAGSPSLSPRCEWQTEASRSFPREQARRPKQTSKPVEAIGQG